MARSIKIKSIEHRAGATYVRVGKSETEIPGGKAEFRQWIRERFRDSDEMLLALVLAAWLKRDQQLDNPELIVGKTVTLDLDGNLGSTDGIVRLA